MKITTLRDWTGGEHSTKQAAFKATWPSTRNMLESEVRAIRGQRPVLQLDVDPEDFRLDGDLRVSINDRTPRVRFLFDTTDGTMVFQAGQYKTWQDNARAIALTLEALRGVDRWGAAQGGAQYKGYLELETGTSPSYRATAIGVLNSYAGTQATADADDETLQRVLRRARLAAHPDHGGTPGAFNDVQAAARTLRLLS